jgi:hypothetical protein
MMMMMMTMLHVYYVWEKNKKSFRFGSLQMLREAVVLRVAANLQTLSSLLQSVNALLV